MFTGIFSTHINYKRMKSSLDYVFYASVFLFVEGVTGRIINPPSNAVAEVGGQAIFNCTSDTTVQSWIFSTNREEYETSTGQTIVAGCIVQTGFTSNYAVDRPGGSNFICNLIVKATTMQQSGVYTCTDTGPGPSAILTVIDRNASITVSRDPETLEGDTVRMYYSVRYSTSTASPRTPTIPPVLSWTDSDGNTVAGSPTNTTNSVLSFISVDAKRKDITPYTCHISCVINSSSLATGQPFASNTPNSLPNPPTTATINVLYNPIISEITMSDKAPVCPGKTVVEITCHATANPAPIYSWIGPNSRNYSGATIEVAMNGTYSCTASNVIRGSTHSDTKDAPITVLCGFWFVLLLWLINPIAADIFLIHYQYGQHRVNYNARYPFLTNMLPCRNDTQETMCRRVGWVILFIFMMIFSGIQFLILTIVTLYGCCTNITPRFQTVCLALSFLYTIIGMILFATSVGVIYHACNEQCSR